jgi:ribosome-binding factor A
VTERTARLDQLLREEISAIIGREIADPRIGFVTVTDVDVTPDLSHATVWVSVIGDQAQRTGSLRALRRAMPFVRHRLGELRLKRIPELHVKEDDAAQRATRVLQILHDIEAGEEPGAATPGETLPSPEPIRGIPEPPVPRRPRTRAADRGGPAHSGHGHARHAGTPGKGTRRGR